MKKISYKGQLLTVREAATLSGVSYDSLRNRLKQNLPEHILFQPPEEKWKHWWVLNLLIREKSGEERKKIEDTIVKFLADQKRQSNKNRYRYVRSLLILNEILRAKSHRIEIVRKAAMKFKNKKDTGKIPVFSS